ncbi:MAG: hypothetical protein GY854_02360 [Deltaproteobacteria bacterium]|nr:hypothetical protein [Deltaproteobacteria bacterium]
MKLGNLTGVLGSIFSIGKANRVEIENSGGSLLFKTGGQDRGRFTASGVFHVGEISLEDAGGVVRLSTPGTNLTANGIIVSGQVDTNVTGVGAVLFLNTDGNWDEAQANAATTVGQLGIALETDTGAAKKILLYGIVRNDAWAWSVGGQTGALYVSGATAGAMMQSAPTTSGHQIQKCGYALSTDVIMFAPSPDIGEYVP